MGPGHAGVGETGATTLDAEDWKRLMTLLDTALDLEPDALAHWLASFDGAQSRLRPALDRLLHDRAAVAGSGFMTTSARTPVGDPRERLFEAREGHVGPYRLLREIGRGGTATVWLAERADGLLARRVALKLPDIGAYDPAFADRMARERHILASLTHPNIARLYDAGIESNGRPYLALEYVEGQPIDVFARSRDLPVRARVALLAQVARAVGYAHAQLVVHRDLKPSNILVDVEGRVHLVDFGIAKLIDPSIDAFAHRPDQTMMIGRALTPDYASPEQIRGDPIGTASDVYSLGVVAFELLCDARPYRLDASRGAVALAEAIARVDVPRASNSAIDRRLRAELEGDLDAVLARMLAKAIEDRYATADALADDLDRHLAGEPVRARVASRTYVARRWIDRHRIESGVGIAVVLAVAGGAYAQVIVALALGTGALLALWQRNQAIRQAELARAALLRGEQVKSFVASIFTHAVPRPGGGGVAATDLLKSAARRVETDLSGQPAVAAELAALIGASFNELGDVRAGFDWLPRAVDLCTREFGALHPLSLQSRRRWVDAANLIGDLGVSESLLPKLLADLRSAQPAQAELLVHGLRSEAFVHTKRGREREAMASLNEAVSVALREFGEAGEATLSARASLSNTLMHFARTTEGLEAIEPAMTWATAAYGNQRPHLILTMIERNHADALAANQRPREAAHILRQVVLDQTSLDGGETNRVRFAVSMLAKAQLLRGQFVEATALFADAAAMHERLTGALNDEGMVTWTVLALAWALRGDGDAALKHLARARRCITHEPGLAQTSKLDVGLALAFAAIGDFAAAIEAADGLLEKSDSLSATVRLRAQRVRVIALRRTDEVEKSLVAASHALASIDPECGALEHGLMLVESARACRELADEEGAQADWRRAVAVWDAGQVDGEDLRAPLRNEFAKASCDSHRAAFVSQA